MKKMYFMLIIITALSLEGCDSQSKTNKEISPDSPMRIEENDSAESISRERTDSLSTSELSAQATSSSPTSWFKKTTNKCSICKSGNGCSGYWGIYHSNGTYEGNCSNSDGYGHRCGHGPEKHGLKRWQRIIGRTLRRNRCEQGLQEVNDIGFVLGLAQYETGCCTDDKL